MVGVPGGDFPIGPVSTHSSGLRRPRPAPTSPPKGYPKVCALRLYRSFEPGLGPPSGFTVHSASGGGSFGADPAALGAESVSGLANHLEGAQPLPFYHAWVLRAACFWNALASTQGFHKQIALDVVMLALQGHVRIWVHGLRHSLSVVGYNMHLDPAAMHSIDVSELRICLSAHLARAWNNLAPTPRACPSAGAHQKVTIALRGNGNRNKFALLFVGRANHRK